MKRTLLLLAAVATAAITLSAPASAQEAARPARPDVAAATRRPDTGEVTRAQIQRWLAAGVAPGRIRAYLQSLNAGGRADRGVVRPERPDTTRPDALRPEAARPNAVARAPVRAGVNVGN
jgi:hypothetical protein